MLFFLHLWDLHQQFLLFYFLITEERICESEAAMKKVG